MDPASTHGLWADLSKADFTPADSDFTVIGVPYDGAASRERCSTGPERIRFGQLTPFSGTARALVNSRRDLGDFPSTNKRGFESIRKK
jgi:arginase family enzyme